MFLVTPKHVAAQLRRIVEILVNKAGRDGVVYGEFRAESPKRLRNLTVARGALRVIVDLSRKPDLLADLCPRVSSTKPKDAKGYSFPLLKAALSLALAKAVR